MTKWKVFKDADKWWVTNNNHRRAFTSGAEAITWADSAIRRRQELYLLRRRQEEFTRPPIFWKVFHGERTT